MTTWATEIGARSSERWTFRSRMGGRFTPTTPADIRAPTIILHGEHDRIAPSAHATWLAARVPDADLWLRPREGHISVLRSAPEALERLVSLAGQSSATMRRAR